MGEESVMRQLPFGLLIVALLASSLGREASAQRKKKPERKKNRMTLKGTFEGIAGRGIIKVKSAGGEPWLVKVEAKVDDIRISGAATFDYLRPGMWINFTGQFDKRGNALGELGQLKLISKRSSTRPGVSKDKEFGDEESPFNEEKKSKAAGSNYFVVGQITSAKASAKQNRLIVKTGGKPVKVEVAKDAKIEVDLADLRVPRRGDKIELACWYYEKGKAVCDKTVEVVLGKPLGGGKKKKR